MPRALFRALLGEVRFAFPIAHPRSPGRFGGNLKVPASIPPTMEMTPAFKAKLDEHVGMHVDKYPADCNDLVMACSNLSEFSAAEKEWFSQTLPHGMYENPTDVKKAIHL